LQAWELMMEMSKGVLYPFIPELSSGSPQRIVDAHTAVLLCAGVDLGLCAGMAAAPVSTPAVAGNDAPLHLLLQLLSTSRVFFRLAGLIYRPFPRSLRGSYLSSRPISARRAMPNRQSNSRPSASYNCLAFSWTNKSQPSHLPGEQPKIKDG
jgi:hypothetical protein